MMKKLLKKAYKTLSRFPVVTRCREAWRQHVELHYWPWYRWKPTKLGIEPDPKRYKHELIVSLTSFPARIHLVHFAVYSLLKQSLKPNRIVLWLADSQFPGKELDLPRELLALKPLGLEIRWCEDIKSFKKLIPSLREWPEAIIVTADDDMHYPRPWLESLYQSHLSHNREIQAGGIHPIALDADGLPLPYAKWGWNPPDGLSAFRNVPVGAFGTLYPPHCLHPDVLDQESFLRLAPSADDLWFWAMAIRAGTRVRLISSNRQQPINCPGMTETSSLYSTNGKGGGNDACMANLVCAYPELLARLASESTPK